MAVLLLGWPSSPLLVSWPVSCSSLLLLALCWETQQAPQPWHTYGGPVLEGQHYQSYFSGLQLQSYGLTSFKGSRKRMKWSPPPVNPPLRGVVVLIACHFHLMSVAPFAQQKVKLIHRNYFIL